MTKRYGATRVVDSVSLTMDRGRFLTLLGPSGSGKTTLLMMIAGFVQPSAGEIVLDGRRLTNIPPDRRNFGMVFQGYALFPHLNVEENVAFSLSVRGRSTAEIHQRIRRMDGFPLALPALGADAEHAVDFLIDRLKSSLEPVTLVCLAPLTNNAVALVKAPEIQAKVAEIVFMGGARRAGGNVTPCATFNLFCDPHAAHVVFESGRRLTLLSLDASAMVIAGPQIVAAISDRQGAVPQATAAMLDFFNRRRIGVYGYAEDQTSLNDPCVVAYPLDPSLFSGREANVSVEHRSELTMGMTVVDLLDRTGRPANALWLDTVNSAGVLDRVVRTLTGQA